jgi:putative transposase
MCYAAYKLWNVCNYERLHYKEIGLAKYPDWYYQKKAHKDALWARQLPSQTAQEVCKQLDKSWKSFYELNKSHGIDNPRPPRFKHDGIAITYMQNAIVHETGSPIVRLTLSKHLKMYMSETYGINDKYLFLENKIFKNIDNIKQIKVYPPSNGECRIIVIYETEDVVPKPDNGNYLSVDLGIHNLMTCYNSRNGETFIAGRKYLSLCHYYNKEIGRVQSQWSNQQYKKGVKYPKSSKHINKLYAKKNNAITDYIHKITRYIVNYCINNDINTVVIGDITNIRKNKDFGNVTNQKLHALPYKKIYTMLDYKLAQEGITLVKQKESYSSQTSPLSPGVDKYNADKHNRVKRGLYRDGLYSWNADCVGAYNILRLYFAKQKIDVRLDPTSIKEPFISKVAA